MKTALAAILFSCTLSSAAAGQMTSGTGTDQVRAARNAWVAAFNARDTVALVRSYTADATMVNASGRVLQAADLPGFFRSAVATFSAISVEIELLDVDGATVWEVSRYTDMFHPPGTAPIPHGGTQLVVWRLTADGWKQAAVMVSSVFSRLTVPG
jgi:ketosteroid isomerase-like protein